MAHARLVGGAVARPEVARVVAVGAVDHRRQPLALGDGAQRPVQLGLAVVAAVGRILDEAGDLELGGLDDLVPHSQMLRERPRLGDLLGQVGLARRRHREHPVRAQLLEREGQHHRGVHAARERHHRRSSAPRAHSLTSERTRSLLR